MASRSHTVSRVLPERERTNDRNTQNASFNSQIVEMISVAQGSAICCVLIDAACSPIGKKLG